MESKSNPGYWENGHGALVPTSKVKDIDKLRDKVVRELVAKALELHASMQEVKQLCSNDIQDFIDISAEKYGVNLGRVKGNVALQSYDGKYKIQRAMADLISFDERLQIAKALIFECIEEWTEGASDEIKVLVSRAFETDRAGKISTSRILGLRQIKIEHPKWQKALEIIAESININGSKPYIRFYERDEHGAYKAISLDFATI